MVDSAPPFSTEMEAAALGSFLIDPDAFTEHGATLAPERFYRDAHGLIFAAMRDLHTRGEPCDLVLLTDEIERRGQLETVGGADYITQLSCNVPTSAHVAHYVQRVIELAQQRDTRHAVDTYVKETYAGKADALARQQTRLEAIAAYAGKADTANNPYVGHSPAELRQRPPVKWFIDGIIAEHTQCITYGDSECGKSLTWQDIMMHVALGWKWRGRQTAQGHIWYVAAEGANGLTPRLSAWADEHHVSEERTDPFIHITEVPVPLMNPDEVQRLIAAIQSTDFSDAPLRLVIFDTFSRCMAGGDENDNNDARDALANAELVQRATGAVVMVIHHSGKNDGYRGASALRANVDTMLRIETKDGKSIMTCDKQKDGAPHFAPIASIAKGVKRLGWDLEYPVMVAAEYEAPQAAEKLAGNPQKVVNALAVLGFGTFSQIAKTGNVNPDSLSKVLRDLDKSHTILKDGEKDSYTLTAKGRNYVTIPLPSKPSNHRHDGFDGEQKEPSSPSSSYRDDGDDGNADGSTWIQDDVAEKCACGADVETITPDGISLCLSCQQRIMHEQRVIPFRKNHAAL